MKKIASILPILYFVACAFATTPPGDPALKGAVTIYERPFPDRIRDLLKLPDGRVIREANYLLKDGRQILDGPTIVWSLDGGLREVQVWQQGRQAGVWLHYFPSGVLASLDSFLDGKSAERREWYPSGRLATDWIRKSDGWHFRNYDESGKITTEGVTPEKKEKPNQASEPTAPSGRGSP